MAIRGRFSAWLFVFIALRVSAQQYSPDLLGGLQWRDVGPMRAGRSYAVAGNSAQPDTFYTGSVGGGVWKTENAGRTWFSIGDDATTGIPIGSIGAIAVAPSDPNIVYVGTGEPDIRSQHSYGIGLFKSTDAGKTWHSIGLAETRQIGKIVVDSADPNRVRPRGLSLNRRWRALEENSLERERPGRRGRDRPCDRPAASAHPLCVAVGDAPSAVGGVRTTQYARWRPL